MGRDRNGASGFLTNTLFILLMLAGAVRAGVDGGTLDLHVKVSV